jgi:hypothetical protein
MSYPIDIMLKFANKIISVPRTVPSETVPKGWLRGRDLNARPQGYEPCELPGCSTPRLGKERTLRSL